MFSDTKVSCKLRNKKATECVATSIPQKEGATLMVTEITMIEHDERPGLPTAGEVCVRRCAADIERILDTYDATPQVGLSTIICDAAIERVDETGAETIELPKPQELYAAAAIARCLMPIKLQGWEVKAMRKIMKLTLAEFARRLDERTAPETVSRWETDAQPMGGYAERIIRLLVCEELKKEAPGIEYNGSLLANLKVRDPFRADPNYELPPIVLRLIKLKEVSAGLFFWSWEDGQQTEAVYCETSFPIALNSPPSVTSTT